MLPQKYIPTGARYHASSPASGSDAGVFPLSYLYTFYIFAVMFGFTFLITAPLTTTRVGRLYGFSHIGLISGFITMIHHMGGGLWAYIGGWSFDTTGSYQWSFIVSAVMACIALIGTLMIKEKRQLIRP